jgi:hypothetical protein
VHKAFGLTDDIDSSWRVTDADACDGLGVGVFALTSVG